MSRKLLFGRASFIAVVIVALCTNVSFGRGGGGGGHGGGGFGGGHGGGGWGGGRGGGGWSGGGAMHAGSFGSVAPSHAWGGSQFAHPGSGMAYSAHRPYGLNGGEHGNWNGGRYGNSYGRHDWDNYFGRGGRGGWGGWGWGGYWPWYGGWGLGWGYPYDYGYYYPGASDYYYTYAPSDYGYTDTGVPAEQFADSPVTPPTTSEDQPAPGEAAQFYSEARAAFLEGDYRNALRLAGHAGVEAPRNPKVHELISLALLASNNYPAAASEAHAAMALGTIADWQDLFGYYNDAGKYTAQFAPGKGVGREPQVRRRSFPAGVSLPDDRFARQRQGRACRGAEADAQRQACQPLPGGAAVQLAADASQDGGSAAGQTVPGRDRRTRALTLRGCAGAGCGEE